MEWLDDDDSEFDQVEFDRGPEKRLSMVLLLDTSHSMSFTKEYDSTRSPTPIAELNRALRQWAEEMKSDRMVRQRLEIAIISFGKGGVVVHSEQNDLFVPAALFDPPEFEAGGTTPMIEAIREAEQVLAIRKSQLDAMKRTRFRPMIAMISDGHPTDVEGRQRNDWASDAADFRLAQSDDPARGRRYVFCAFGTSKADITVLRALTDQKAMLISQTEFLKTLQFLTISASSADPIADIYNLFQPAPGR